MTTVKITDAGGNKPTFVQWDVDRVLRVSGVASQPFLHFANHELKRAIVVPATETSTGSGIWTANVPNCILQYACPMIVSVFLQPNEGYTVCTAVFPVQPKVQPQDYSYTENIGYINWVQKSEEVQALIDEIQEMLDNGELKGDPFTYDDFSAAQLEALTGPDGYSPTVSVTTISGGHKVTITDKTGDHEFNVMDGEGSGTSNFFVAEYGVTGIAALEEAYQAGKTIVCARGVKMYTLTGRVEDPQGWEDPTYYFGLAEKDGYIEAWFNGSWNSAYTDRDMQSTPKMDGTATAGTSDAYSKADHVHPTDTSRLSAFQGVSNAGKVLGISPTGDVVPTNAPPALIREELKLALLQIADKMAYADDNGEKYYQDLYDALYPTQQVKNISAVFDSGSTHIYTTDSIYSLRQYLTVTVTYIDDSQETITDYTLSGNMAAGTQTMTVGYNGKTTTFTVSIIELVLTSITAVFTQGSAVIYDTTPLSGLKQYLTVTAHYTDETTSDIVDYQLSGTLSAGTSTVTVSFGGQTTTFTVTVTHEAGVYAISNVLTNCTTSNSATSVTENGSYVAALTADTGYTLTGATVSVTMGGNDVTSTVYANGNITIASVTGAVVITVSAALVVLSSISAVYTQPGTVYDSDSLDSLKEDLVVTATYSDTTTAVVSTYTLTGTMAAGTQTITVTYNGKTTTFTVVVTAASLVPADYQLVEYIAIPSISNPYGPFFNTGYTPTMTGDLVLEVDCMHTTAQNANAYPIGVCQPGTSSNVGAGVYFPTTGTEAGAFNGSSAIITLDSSTAINKRYTLTGTFRSTGYETITDGTSSASNTNESARSYNGVPVCLFGVKKRTTNQIVAPFDGRIYHAKVTENNELKRDLYPCYKKSDNTPGFYDRVEDIFHEKSGSGTAQVTVGPDVTE